jgi:hypothetical protein
MKRLIFVFIMIVTIVTWAIVVSNSLTDGGSLSVERHTADTVGTSVWDRSASGVNHTVHPSGGKADSHKGCPYENSYT